MLTKLYYKLTAYIPRLLPRTSEEYAQFKQIMHEYYHVPDKSESWAVIASQVQGVPTSRLRKDFGSMANAVKRMEVNQVAQDDKVKCFSVINLKLKEAAEREIDKSRNASQSIPSLHEGASEPPGEMLGMPETQTALV